MTSRRATVIAHRLVQIPPVLLIVSVLVFALVQVLPGDPGRNALGPYASSDQVAAWNVAHGLTGGAFEQYTAWVGSFVTGHWGTSAVYGVPVRELVMGRLANSVALGLFAIALAVPLALAIGVFQARREGSRGDRSLTVALMALAAVPEFVVGVVLLVALAVAVPVLPVQSGAALAEGPLPGLRAMVLPALTLALATLPILARMVRAGVIDVMGSQFYRTAVVKGVGRWMLVLGHTARNALIPTVAVLGIHLGALLGGSAVVETLFGYPGLGELLVTATQKKDTAVLVAAVMLTGLLSLIALLVADIAFTLLDPRVRFSRRPSP